MSDDTRAIQDDAASRRRKLLGYMDDKAEVADLRNRVARLECAGDFARLIGNDASKDDKDTVLVTYGMLRRLRDAIADGGKHA